jgi:hypothetical protein
MCSTVKARLETQISSLAFDINPLENFKSLSSDGSYGVSKNVFSAAVNVTHLWLTLRSPN